MSEYWKSNAKKYCDYCKVWIQDNKASISIHESGNKHKQAVSAKLDQIKKNAAQKKIEEKKMSESMAAIERAALESMKSDIAANPSLKKQYGSVKTTTEQISKTADEPKKPIDKKTLTKKPTENSKTAIKRKSDTIAEAKIGKWQQSELKKPEPQKNTEFVDLQLPVVNKGPINKSLHNCFTVDPSFNKQSVNDDKAVQDTKSNIKEEPKNKWIAVGFTSVEDESKPNNQNQEAAAFSNDIPNELETNKINNEIPFIKTEKVDSTEKESVSDKSVKKEKVIMFKKRKVDANQFRTRSDD